MRNRWRKKGLKETEMKRKGVREKEEECTIRVKMNGELRTSGPKALEVEEMIATIALPLILTLSTLLPCSNNTQRAELDDRGGDRREVGQTGES